MRSRAATAGTVLTARLALEHGVACNTAGGSHHAFAEGGTGFCVFNDVAVAALLLLEEGTVHRVLVVDLDVHQGDGTAAIFEGDSRVVTFSVHCRTNFPARKRQSDLDVALDPGTTDDDYLTALERALTSLIDRVRPDLAFLNAGVDPHADDRLGRLALSDAGLAERERSGARCMPRPWRRARLRGWGRLCSDVGCAGGTPRDRLRRDPRPTQLVARRRSSVGIGQDEDLAGVHDVGRIERALDGSPSSRPRRHAPGPGSASCRARYRARRCRCRPSRAPGRPCAHSRPRPAPTRPGRRDRAP